MSTTITLTETATLSAQISLLEPRWRDLILIEHPPRLLDGRVLHELTIADTLWSSPLANLSLLTIQSEDWVSFYLNINSAGTTSRASMPYAHPAHFIPHDRTVDAGTIITLRPSNKTIIENMFGGDCPYERCYIGIVLVNDISSDELDLKSSSRAALLTLCPCCMSIEVLREHEELVRDVASAQMLESTAGQILRDSAIRGHRERVDDARLRLGYAVLPIDPGLYGLGVQSTSNTDEIEVASLAGYLNTVGCNEIGPPAITASVFNPGLRQPPTQVSRRGEHLVASPRGRQGRRTQGHVEFRRLDIDRRPGSGPTYEVSLGDDETRLAEATLRVQDYHATLMGPPQSNLQTLDGATAPRDALHQQDQTTLQQAITGAFNTTDLSNLRPRTPTSSEHPRALYSSAVCTEPFRWYAMIQERVINDICGICLEDFQSRASLSITGLPCGHFFHEDCVRERRMGERRVDVRCPYRCVGLVRM